MGCISTLFFGQNDCCHAADSTSHDSRSIKSTATRVTHEGLACGQFPNASTALSRYASLLPGTAALHLLYRGLMIPDSGVLPDDWAIYCATIPVAGGNVTPIRSAGSAAG